MESSPLSEIAVMELENLSNDTTAAETLSIPSPPPENHATQGLSRRGIIRFPNLPKWLNRGERERVQVESVEVQISSSLGKEVLEEGQTSGTYEGNAVEILNAKLKDFHKTQPDCTIYRVYEHLRIVNEKAYEPEVISIGPYHRGKDNLQMLEDQKLHYLQLLLERGNGITIESLVSAIESHTEVALMCYAESVTLDPSEFVEMMVLDSCFIIELLRKYDKQHNPEFNDPIFYMDWIMNSLQRDMLLFENQIPFCILWKLFSFTGGSHHTQPKDLFNLINNFFNNLYPGTLNNTLEEDCPNPDKVSHLLGLIHYTCKPLLEPFDEQRPQSTVKQGAIRRRGIRKPSNSDEESQINDIIEQRFIHTATWLSDANVTFVKDESKRMLNITFKNGTMSMSPLKIEERTESFFRNLMAYEEYSHSTDRYISDYVKVLDCLINTSEDVQILSRCGIINNWLGEDKVVADMFNKLTELVTDPGRSGFYDELHKKVTCHCKKKEKCLGCKLEEQVSEQSMEYYFDNCSCYFTWINADSNCLFNNR